MSRHSDDQLETAYFIHVRRKSKGAYMLARVRGREAEFLIPPEYPEALVDDAIEHLGFMLDGVFMASTFEWWPVDDEPGPQVIEAIGGTEEGFPAFVKSAWETHDLQSRPHGSPSGRAGGGEPPAPAAD
jgi:hypothetical protein